jgi:4'-phosphopantetheinyl transferase
VEHSNIDVWCVRLEAPDAEVNRFRDSLSVDETARAQRFRFEHLRRKFIIARGVLRVLLGRYLDLPPESIAFHYTSTGKPILAVDCGIHFNVSHSGQVALFAFARDCEVGIDVEQIRPLPEMLSIAERFFSAEETAELVETPDDERERAFFRCWTRKEAYIKATGEGLSAPLDQFAVAFRDGEAARLLNLQGNTEAALEWILYDIQLPDDYTGALAYRGQPRSIIYRLHSHLFFSAHPAIQLEI